jgi:hypothetical protein
MDLETYAGLLPDYGATEIEAGTLNGLPCVTYQVPANKSFNVAFATQAGYILEAIVAPVTTEEEMLAANIILASIQPYEAE